MSKVGFRCMKAFAEIGADFLFDVPLRSKVTKFNESPHDEVMGPCTKFRYDPSGC